MARQTLTREKVLDAALRLADAEGLAGLSMRKLAAEVGVEAMSLYNHVKNKRDLLDGIASRVFESIPLPEPEQPWEDRLRALGNATFAAFNAHPVVVRAMATDQASPHSPGALRLIDSILGALLDAGLGEYHAARSYRSLLGMIFGAVLLGPGGQKDEPATEFARLAKGFPHLSAALPELTRIDCLQDFQYQLELLLNGLRTPGSCSP